VFVLDYTPQGHSAIKINIPPPVFTDYKKERLEIEKSRKKSDADFDKALADELDNLLNADGLEP
jgi:hypothetical protein